LDAFKKFLHGGNKETWEKNELQAIYYVLYAMAERENNIDESELIEMCGLMQLLPGVLLY